VHNKFLDFKRPEKLSSECGQTRRYLVCSIFVSGDIDTALKESYKMLLCELLEAESKRGQNFQSDTKMFCYLTFWQQFSVIRPSSGHIYIKFKTGYM
jgi:hypothetical protein